MLIDRPIFLNCFSRGGSNILWNIFLSHPDVCSPIRPKIHLIDQRLRQATMAGFKAALLCRQWGFFDQWLLAARPPISAKAAGYIDRVLHENKMRTLQDAEMRFKYEDVPYSREEVVGSRLVAKNNNGLAFLSRSLQVIYPQVFFIALLRHPFPLYEGYTRRGIFADIEAFSRFYRTLVERFQRDEAELPHYRILKFEDLLQAPVTAARDLYGFTELDPAKVTRLRLKSKSHFGKDGTRVVKFAKNQHFWFEFDQVFEMLEPNVNDHQIGLLSDAEKAELYRRNGDLMDHFGYLPQASTTAAPE